MKLAKEDILNLVKSGHISKMPDGTFVAGFDDIDGSYYPISELDVYYAGRDCELYTHLTHALGGFEFFLRFF